MYRQSAPTVAPLLQHRKRVGLAFAGGFNQRDRVLIQQQGTLFIELFVGEGHQILTPLRQQAAMLRQ